MTKDLPSLGEVFSDFSEFPKGASRQSVLTDDLRKCARNLQKDSPRPFYSMREVSAFFSVPLRTVALAYESLDMEGLLHRMRGSQTTLAGRKPATRHPVNAIVGLPIWLQAMITSPFECNLQMELEERLRARGYVADSIFYQSREDFEPTFTERLLRHNLDLLIWQSPHPLSSHVLMSLRERGLRLILIQSVENVLSLPARTHLLDWQPAYQQMISHWQTDEVRNIIVPEPVNLIARRALRQLRSQVENSSLQLTALEPSHESLQNHFSDPALSRSVLAFMDFHSADHLCNGYPELIEKIASRHRIAFCRGPVRALRLTTQKIGVDLVEIDPVDLAMKVVDDLCDPEQVQEGVRGTIQAKFFPDQVMSGLHDWNRNQLNL